MLYKYLFYSVSYWVKKYDHLWKVGDTYFVGGGMIVGIIIALTIINIINLLGIFFLSELVWLRWKPLLYLPLILGISSTIIFGYKKRHEVIYEEVKNMDIKKKNRYKILNIFHIILILGIYFNILNILKLVE